MLIRLEFHDARGDMVNSRSVKTSSSPCTDRNGVLLSESHRFPQPLGTFLVPMMIGARICVFHEYLLSWYILHRRLRPRSYGCVLGGGWILLDLSYTPFSSTFRHFVIRAAVG